MPGRRQPQAVGGHADASPTRGLGSPGVPGGRAFLVEAVTGGWRKRAVALAVVVLAVGVVYAVSGAVAGASSGVTISHTADEPVEVSPGDTVSFEVSSLDLSGGRPSVSHVGGPGDSFRCSTGSDPNEKDCTYKWTPGEEHAGSSYTPGFKATNNEGRTARDSVTIKVSEDDDPPDGNESPPRIMLSADDPIEVSPDEPARFSLMASDDDGRKVWVSKVSGHGDLTCHRRSRDAVECSFEWTPKERHAGSSYDVVVEARNNIGQTERATATIRVADDDEPDPPPEPSPPPVFKRPDDGETIEAGVTVSLPVVAEAHPDDDDVDHVQVAKTSGRGSLECQRASPRRTECRFEWPRDHVDPQDVAFEATSQPGGESAQVSVTIVLDTGYQGCTVDSVDGDADKDGLSNATEIDLAEEIFIEGGKGTNPCDRDTDGDWLFDSWELPDKVDGAGFHLDSDDDPEASRDEVFMPDEVKDDTEDDPEEPTVDGDKRRVTQGMFGGLPDPLHKDVYFEMDWQDCRIGDNCIQAPGRHLDPVDDKVPEDWRLDDMHHAPDVRALERVREMFGTLGVGNEDGESGVNLHILVDERLPHDPNCDQKSSALRSDNFGTEQQRDHPDVLEAKKMAVRYVWSGHSSAKDNAAECPTPFWDVARIGKGQEPIPEYDNSPFGSAMTNGRDVLVTLGPVWNCPHPELVDGDGICDRGQGSQAQGMFPGWVDVDEDEVDSFEQGSCPPIRSAGPGPDPEPADFGWTCVDVPYARLLLSAEDDCRASDQLRACEEQGITQLWGRTLAHLLGHTLGLDHRNAGNNPNAEGRRPVDAYQDPSQLTYARELYDVTASGTPTLPDDEPGELTHTENTVFDNSIQDLLAQDRDGDDVIEREDNCTGVANPGQQDVDADGVGDACDGDIDGDGVGNAEDEFPRDSDNDGVANDEDDDKDGDGVTDSDDNCRLVANAGQSDADGDGVGDACDDDADDDGFVDAVEEVTASDPLDGDSTPEFVGRDAVCSDGSDNDGDGKVDGDDEGCRDADDDSMPDHLDPCPTTPTASWVDGDGDGLGRACDDDDANDGSEDNTAPTADAGGGYETEEGTAITLDGTGSSDSDGTVGLHRWDLDGDGDHDEAIGPQAEQTYPDNGEFPVGLRVTDNLGASAADTASVTVTNVAPELTGLAVDPSAIDEGGQATVSGSFTDPGSEDTHEVVIEWGDGEDTTLELTDGERSFEAEHTYRDNPAGEPEGSYPVSVTVTDKDGGQDRDSTEITVANVAPELTKVSGDETTEGLAGEPASVSGEFTDPGGEDEHTVTVDWGDGTSDTRTVEVGERSFSLTHHYRDDNPSGSPSDDYTVRVAVADDDSGRDTAETMVTVNNVAPEITDLSGDDIAEGETATVRAEFVDQGLDDTHEATVDWGDGISESVDVEPGIGIPEMKGGVVQGSHVYGDDGDYTVTVTVVDDDTGKDRATTTASVANQNPSGQLDTDSAIAFPGGTAFFGEKNAEQPHSAEGRDAGSDDLAFAWSFAWRSGSSSSATTTYFNDTGDPSGSPDPDLSPHGTFPFSASDTARFTPDRAGVADVTLDLTDDDGGADTAGLVKLVTGDRVCTRSQGFWKHQASDKGRQHVDETTLARYLSVTDVGSSVFSELVAAATIEQAEDVLWPQGPSMRDKAEAQLLAAWLNVSSGAIGWNEGVDGTAAGERLAQAEDILHDADASHQQLEQAKDQAEAVNLHDQDNPDCNQGGGDAGNENNGGQPAGSGGAGSSGSN